MVSANGKMQSSKGYAHGKRRFNGCILCFWLAWEIRIRSGETWLRKPRGWIDLSTIDIINAIPIPAIDRRKNSAVLVNIKSASLVTTDIGDRADGAPEQRPVPNNL